MQSSNEKRQTKLKTPFLRIPTVDWSRVRCGDKRELRAHHDGGWMPYAKNIPYFPIAVVAYAQFQVARQEQLMILDDAWLEPLRAITQEAIEREGFRDRTEFKHYWNRRHPRGGWRGMSKVIVIRVRPLEDGDLEEQRAKLLEHFYGEWL